jgi:coenzyme F420-dependent glucose-6-phosphate dehydrogenase
MAKIYYYLGHEQFHPEALVKHARLAEEVGFDGLFVSDHFNPWVADVGAAGFAFSTLGAIAQVTKKVALLPGVTTPLFRYHPALIAQAAATIDRLSGGRFMLGVGTGESINEAPLGFTFPDYKERSARMKEALEIMHKLLHGEKVTYEGTYYQTKNAKLYSPPLHDMPIYMAAGGPKSGLLAAEYADGLILSVKDPKETKEKILLPSKEKSQEFNKQNFGIVASRWTIFAKNNDEAWQALQAWRGLRAPSRDKATDPEELQKEADTMPREEILSKYVQVKNAADYIEQYTPLVKTVGADIVAIQTTGADQEAIIQMLGKEVLPTLQSL